MTRTQAQVQSRRFQRKQCQHLYVGVQLDAPKWIGKQNKRIQRLRCVYDRNMQRRSVLSSIGTVMILRIEGVGKNDIWGARN